MLECSKRGKGHGRGNDGRGGDGARRDGGGTTNLATNEQIAGTGKNKSRPLGVVIVLPKTKKWRG